MDKWLAESHSAQKKVFLLVMWRAKNLDICN